MDKIYKFFLLWNELQFVGDKGKADKSIKVFNQHYLISQLAIAKLFLAVATLAVSLSAFTIKPVRAASGPYCQFIPQEAEAKEKLLKASLGEDSEAINAYQEILAKHTQMLQLCRSQTWPEEQAIWLRLYPCDVSAGAIDSVLDRIVNLGYNKVHLEVFYDSQVLLPPAENSTPWTSVVRSPGGENIDLLQQTIDKARQRGIKVYAWLFTMNFGYTYAQRPDRQAALARNGKGIDSLTFVHDQSQAFVDPYSPQAQTDYYNLVQAVLKRQPDGILFDYVRYPQGTGGQSYVHNVKDLWVYGESSLKALSNRAGNKKGAAVIKQYVNQGSLTLQNLKVIDHQYPKQKHARWQGRQQLPSNNATLESRQQSLNKDLWFFAVAHAAQGVIDFLDFAAKPAQNQGLPAGAVFFPEGNRLIGKTGFDSRLQAWDKFPQDLEWHPMAYGVCDGQTDCVTEQVKTVLKTAPANTKVTPALAGAWGKVYRDHPTLEAQMEALRRATPEITSVSHFGYSWQEPDQDRQRKSCKFL